MELIGLGFFYGAHEMVTGMGGVVGLRSINGTHE